MSMVTFEKPAERVALPDWYATTWEMRQTADARQSDSFNLRAEGRQLRSETALKTKWDTYHSDTCLHDRVTEVSRWQDVLEQCLLSVKKEIAKLREEKAATERELESLGVHLNTVADCIRQRDRRYGSDLVLMDEGDVELKNKKASSMKQAELMDMFKKASRSVCTSTVVVSPHSLSPTPSPSSAMKTPENTEEDSDDCESPDEGDIQMEYSSAQLYSPSTEAELGVIEQVKAFLTSKCHNAWVQLNRLRDVQFKLELVIDNKKDAVAIDRGNLEMAKDSAGTSYMPDPLRKPKNIAYEAWLEHSHYNKLQADNEMSASGQLREALYCTREKARNDLQAQHDATDYRLRCRIYQTQRQKNELQWQRQKMMNEMEKLLKEVADLEQALLDKTNPAKLAETRLENRMFRPVPELVQDEVQLGLTDEVLQLRQTCQDLIRKIDDGKATYNALEAHLICLDQHLTNKQHTLMTDLRCLDIRDALKRGNMAPPDTQTERNIQLIKMEEEVSKP